MTDFRFAVQLTGAADGRSWRTVVRRIEDLGYSTLFVADHFSNQWAPIVALTVAAESTERLNVGSLVFDNDYRHPVELARELATLQLASEGRVECGIGAGWMRSDYDQIGLAFDRPGVRIDRMVEGIRIMKDMWSTGSSTWHGDHYVVDRARSVPSAQPAPRLLIGGGSQRVLELAAQHANIVGFNPVMSGGLVNADTARSATAERYDQRVAWVREAAGDRFDQLELQMMTFFVHIGDDRQHVLNDPSLLRKSRFSLPGHLADLGPDILAETPIALIGSVSEICDILEARRARFGASYWVVHEDELDAFAPIVARLSGT